MKLKRMVYTALFVVLIIVGAFIRVPLPYIPFTMQLFFVILAGVLLGAKLGAFSSFIYTVMGLIGIPIFTKGGGISYIFEPSFGYIIGFTLAGFLVGLIVDNNFNFFRVLFASLVGTIIIYIIGIIYFYYIVNIYMGKSMHIKSILMLGFFSTIIGDLISCVIIALVAKRLSQIINLK